MLCDLKVLLLLFNHSHLIWSHFCSTSAAAPVDSVTGIELVVDEINGRSYWGLIEQNMWHLDRSVPALSNTRAKAHFLLWMRSEFPLPQLAADSGWASQHLDWDPTICVLFLCHDSSLRAACWLHVSIVFWCLVLLHNCNSQRDLIHGWCQLWMLLSMWRIGTWWHSLILALFTVV